MKRALLWVVLFCSSCILLHAEDRGILYQEDFSRFSGDGWELEERMFSAVRATNGPATGAFGQLIPG